MNTVNPQHMVEEIRANIAKGDAMKAQLVLNHIDQVDEKFRNRLLYEISRADASFSIPLLTILLADKPELNQTLPAIREMLISTLIAFPELLIENLGNPRIKDKTILVNTAGELRMEQACEALLTLLDAEKDTEQLKNIIDCLGLIGDPRATQTLTDYLYAADRKLIIAATHALGNLQTPEAMNQLAKRMGTDNELDLIILEIFAEVQDPVSLEQLNQTMRSHYARMRTFAKKKLVQLGVKAVPVLLNNLDDPDNDFLIHTLNVLGDIGDESAIMPIRNLLSEEPENANVRFAAYEALALLPLRKGAYTLTAGLTDPEEHVCIAAARAIDGNYNEILAAGIKNLIRLRNDESAYIIKIILNAQVDNIFLSLAGDDYFRATALQIFPALHKDLLHHHILLLRRNGMDDFAMAIKNVSESEKKTVLRQKVCAVDDSRMILNIYKATLHQLGFEPVVFEFPASALDWLEQEKPALVLTDLNMPEITGIELTEKIRKKYSMTELPVIMVTTQSDVQDHTSAKDVGVNAILIKPFNAQSLKDAMARFIPVPDAP